MFYLETENVSTEAYISFPFQGRRSQGRPSRARPVARAARPREPCSSGEAFPYVEGRRSWVPIPHHQCTSVEASLLAMQHIVGPEQLDELPWHD